MVPNCSIAERDKGPPRALSKVLGEGAQRRGRQIFGSRDWSVFDIKAVPVMVAEAILGKKSIGDKI